MKLLGWFQHGRRIAKSNGEEKFERAMAETSDLALCSRSLRLQLEPYKLADDPFAAMMTAREISSSFEEGQEAVIYRGPPR